jgi:hypothetical protein
MLTYRPINHCRDLVWNNVDREVLTRVADGVHRELPVNHASLVGLLDVLVDTG